METPLLPQISHYKLLANGIHKLLTIQSREDIYQTICEVSRQITNSSGTFFVIPENGKLNCVAKDADFRIDREVSIDLNNNPVSKAILSRKITTVQNPDLDAFHSCPVEISNCLIIPVVSENICAALEIYGAQPSDLSEEALECLQKLVDSVLRVIDLQQTPVLFQERERKLIAEAEDLKKEQELFSYAITHDLRAPLRAIRGFVNILVEENTDILKGSGKQLSEKIINNINQMSLMINELTGVFKTGRAELDKTMLPMKFMVETICTQIKDREEKRRILFLVDELPDGEGDQVLVKQVWFNLLENAVKYSSKKGEAIIKIGSIQKDKEIVYYVTDNGIGFEMKYAARLFGAFQRLHSQQQFEGFGIGLALVKKIITRHGGRVWAEAQPNEGATFYFTLNSR